MLSNSRLACEVVVKQIGAGAIGMRRNPARKLAERIANGQAFVAEDGPKIAGEDLRTVFLNWGTSKKAPIIDLPGTKLSEGIITPAGVIIDGGHVQKITIVGSKVDGERVIDLSYLAGSEGGPLPPLVLRNCRILGKLSLTGSHFAFLSIEDCKIEKIDADHCQIDNHCRLTGLAPLFRRRPVAQIRMVAARIDGTADLRSSQLIAPPRTESDGPKRRYADRLALSLASAEIAGRLLLDHGFEAIGGVSLYQATIRNSVVLKTARLQSRDIDTPALDAEELRLSGSFLWANDRPVANEDSSSEPHHHRPPDVVGQIVFRRADIRGDCKFEHCRWATSEGPRQDSRQAHDVWGGIDARWAQIGGQLRLGDGCLVARWSETPLRRQANEPTDGKFGAAIDAWKAQIGKGVRIESGASFHGPLFLNDTRIEHGLIMRGQISLPPPEGPETKIREGVDLKDARISGRVLIDCENLDGGVTFRRARVDGVLELDKLWFRSPVLAGAYTSDDLTDGRATILDLGFASISGALHLGEIQLHWQGGSVASGEIAALCFAEAPHAFWADVATLAFLARDPLNLKRISHREDPPPPRPCLIDLRHLSCRAFDDDQARVWDRISDEWPWRLLLDGVEFQGFGRRRPANAHVDGGTDESELRRQMLKSYADPRWGLPWWRSINFASTPTYSPQPFETFAKAHFSDGQQTIGLDVAHERATLRWCRNYHNLFRSVVLKFPYYAKICLLFSAFVTILAIFLNAYVNERSPDLSDLGMVVFLLSFVGSLVAVRLSPILLLALGWAFKGTFAYGLRPRRAAVTVGVGILVGIVGVANMKSDIVPILHHSTERGVEVGLADGREVALEGCNIAREGLTDRALYAVDVFIPVVDLRHQCAFYIREHNRWLKALKTAYELAGWLIVSMALLTFSGLLRRDIER